MAGGGGRCCCCGTSQGADGETLVPSVRAEWTPPWPFTLRALLLPCPFLAPRLHLTGDSPTREGHRGVPRISEHSLCEVKPREALQGI